MYDPIKEICTYFTKVETLAWQFVYPEKTNVNIKDEWQMYMADDDLGFEATTRIYHFWREEMNSNTLIARASTESFLS